MTFRLLKLLSVAISSILGFFCNFGGTLYGPAPLYGMRAVDFKISGTVRSADQSLPVKGLSVSFRDTANHSNALGSTATDSLGKYSLEIYEAHNRLTGVLSVKDIDSVENGSFIEKDTLITLPAGASTLDLKINRSTQ